MKKALATRRARRLILLLRDQVAAGCPAASRRVKARRSASFQRDHDARDVASTVGPRVRANAWAGVADAAAGAADDDNSGLTGPPLHRTGPASYRRRGWVPAPRRNHAGVFMRLLICLALVAGLAGAAAPAQAEDWVPPANESVDGPVVGFMRSIRVAGDGLADGASHRHRIPRG